MLRVEGVSDASDGDGNVQMGRNMVISNMS